MTVRELHGRLTLDELKEWMAYDRTMDKEWSDKHKHEQELAKSRKMTADERASAFRELLGGRS